MKAIALDSTALSEAVSGEYNRELVDRYGIPLAFDTASGYTAARAQLAQTAVAGLGSVGTSTLAPTNEQAIFSGAASAFKAGTEIAKEDMPIPHVDNPANLTIAVLFLE